MTVKMSMEPKHLTLLTPGPIEVDDDVLLAMQHGAESHTGPDFGTVFGETLRMLRQMLQTRDPASQPFIMSGSGSLGFDQVAANILEPGDAALVLNVGYWGDAFIECMQAYGIVADGIKAPLGGQPTLVEIESALTARDYKAITITHTDTATGVLSDVPAIARLVHKVSSGTLVIVDGVCSIGCEEIMFDDWQLDIVLGASQKALGAPAGLSIVMASGRAIEVFRERKSPPSAYFCSWRNWIPVMRNYELAEQPPLYFATPPCQLIRALHVSLSKILRQPLPDRLEQHKKVSCVVKEAVAEMGLEQIATRQEDQAHSMTAFYLLSGLRSENVLPLLVGKGVMLARGPQREIAGQYIRFAHMGVSVTDPERSDIVNGIKALREVLTDISDSTRNGT